MCVQDRPQDSGLSGCESVSLVPGAATAAAHCDLDTPLCEAHSPLTSHRNKDIDAPKPRSHQQTFSINFRVPADDLVGPAFDTLVRDHADYIESLLPDEGSSDDPLPSLSPSYSTSTATTDGETRTLQSFCVPPQFNLESATSLLNTFRHMLPNFPCIVVPDEETVISLARERPFVLLAILASVSGTQGFQGHALYDEEFRKVLALKAVAADEQSLELVQGLLIYCGW
jgi:hypothetical protein